MERKGMIPLPRIDKKKTSLTFSASIIIAKLYIMLFSSIIEGIWWPLILPTRHSHVIMRKPTAPYRAKPRLS